MIAVERPQPTVRLGAIARLWPETSAVSPIPALDGLRAVAVLLVMLFHSWYKGPGLALQPGQEAQSMWLWSAHTGVHLFFVLSGFLLFLPYAEWIFGLKSRPSAPKFYRRRVLRVGPAFWLSLTILFLAGPITLLRLGHALLHSVFLFNLVPWSSVQFNDVFWTMAIEVQFYACLPLIAMAAYRVARRWGPATAMAVVLLGGTAASMVSGLLALRFRPLGLITWGLVGRYSLSLSLMVFAIGISASFAYTYVTKVARVETRRLRLPAWTLILGGLVLALAIVFIPRIHDLAPNGGSNELLMGWAYGAILLGTVLGAGSIRRIFESPVLRFIGLISYSLYIWHTVVYGVFASHLDFLPTPAERVLAGFALMLLAAVPVAYVSFQVAERPFIGMRRTAG